MFNIRVGKIRLESGGLHFWEFLFYFTTWKLWDAPAVSVQWTIYHVRIEMRQSLLSFNMCWHFQNYPCNSDRERNRTFSHICRSLQKINQHTWNLAHIEKTYYCFFAENLMRKFQSGKKLGFCSAKAVVPVLFLILCSFVVYSTERLMF